MAMAMTMIVTVGIAAAIATMSTKLARVAVR
jgi:hypothetical protein